MWFGDLVTVRWWDDLWLNESFATFASVLCQSEAADTPTPGRRSPTSRSRGPTGRTRAAVDASGATDIPDLHAVEVNFDGITYAKGASVLKQLVAYVGLEAFLAGLRDYFRDHAFATPPSATCSAHSRSRRGATFRTGVTVRSRPPDSISCAPTSTSTPTATFTRFAVCQDGARTRRRRAPRAPHRGRRVRRSRLRQAGAGARGELDLTASSPTSPDCWVCHAAS